MLKKNSRKALSLIMTLAMIVSLSAGLGATASAVPVSSGNWLDIGNYDTDWFVGAPTMGSYNIETAEELAGIAYLVNNGVTDFYGVDITLNGRA